MRRADFHYELPEALIAQRPLVERTASRLLVLDGNTGGLRDTSFSRIGEHLRPGDLLVFNDTRVIPARMLGRKETGGSVEILIERILGQGRALAQIRSSRSPRTGQYLELDQGGAIGIIGRRDGLFELQAPPDTEWESLLARAGRVPLPPYIRRPDDALDRERYQTVYARQPGAIAAPTAGLHFDSALIRALDQQGVGSAYLTLHVGAGTFQPVRVEQIEQHRMHAEHLEVPKVACESVARARAAGGRVIAVGTTSLRALETCATSGELRPYSGETRLFIFPGYRFRVVDALITNFHLPESSLLMLVSALGGLGNVMKAYRHAVEARYRFYSYGDAMLITRPARQMDLLA